MADKPSNRTPTTDQIFEALHASGYLFEHEVASILTEHDYHVDMSWAFIDPDEGKSREIDIRAIKVFNPAARVQVVIELLIECKDASAPLVFMQREKNVREKKLVQPFEFVFPIPTYQIPIRLNTTQSCNAFQHLDLAKDHYYYRDEKKATQFAKIVRKGQDWLANHEGVYDGLILPLAKAASHQRKAAPRYGGRDDDWVSISLMFPTVVLRDHLFSYDLSVEKPELTPVQRVSFLRHIESGTLQGHHLTDFIIVGDVARHLTQDVQPFADAVAACFIREDRRFLRTVQGVL
ncbi:hypothetical protein [Pinirhizobacter soli]|uniref:hypothetical protein n=1 Tax=Pinirhizobacter soli TaxID=2786953 RepID=UPI002029F221|nr:hypothetical protein [Pinirhizobacter soli]